MDVEFIKLEGFVTIEDDEAILRLHLHDLSPEGSLSILNCGDMGWEPGYVPRPDSLDGAIEAFMCDAKYDLAKADEARRRLDLGPRP